MPLSLIPRLKQQHIPERILSIALSGQVFSLSLSDRTRIKSILSVKGCWASNSDLALLATTHAARNANGTPNRIFGHLINHLDT